LGFVAFLYSIIKSKRRSESLIFLALLIAFVFQVYINSSAADWWAGEAFGQRRLISSFPLFTFGFAYLIQKLQRLRPELIAIIVGAFSLYGIYLTLRYASC